MTDKITVLQTEGSTRMMVFKPHDDRFTTMNLTDGYTGDVVCSWTILKRDTPHMVSSYEADGYKIISTININTDEKKEQTPGGNS